MSELTYTVLLTESDLALLFYSLGNTSAMFYDGTNRHIEADNEEFRAFHQLFLKLRAVKQGGD
jgi:hypothetical protein